MSIRNYLAVAALSLAGVDAGIHIIELAPVDAEDRRPINAEQARAVIERRQRAIDARNAMMTPEERAQVAALESHVEARHMRRQDRGF